MKKKIRINAKRTSGELYPLFINGKIDPFLVGYTETIYLYRKDDAIPLCVFWDETHRTLSSVLFNQQLDLELLKRFTRYSIDKPIKEKRMYLITTARKLYNILMNDPDTNAAEEDLKYALGAYLDWEDV